MDYLAQRITPFWNRGKRGKVFRSTSCTDKVRWFRNDIEKGRLLIDSHMGPRWKALSALR
jgi:hypothetical protein